MAQHTNIVVPTKHTRMVSKMICVCTSSTCSNEHRAYAQVNEYYLNAAFS